MKNEMRSKIVTIMTSLQSNPFAYLQHWFSKVIGMPLISFLLFPEMFARNQTLPLVFHLDSSAFVLSPIQYQTKEDSWYSFSGSVTLSHCISKPFWGPYRLVLLGHIDAPATVQWHLTKSACSEEDRTLSPPSHTSITSLCNNPEINCCSWGW